MSERDTFVAQRRADWERLDRLASESKLDGRAPDRLLGFGRMLLEPRDRLCDRARDVALRL